MIFSELNSLLSLHLIKFILVTVFEEVLEITLITAEFDDVLFSSAMIIAPSGSFILNTKLI